MRYESIPERTRQQVEAALERNEPDELLVAVLSVALGWDDVTEAEAVCLRLAEHADPNVRGNAVLGHLARRFGRLSAEAVRVVETAQSDESESVRGQAEAASDDVSSFVQS